MHIDCSSGDTWGTRNPKEQKLRFIRLFHSVSQSSSLVFFFFFSFSFFSFFAFLFCGGSREGAAGWVGNAEVATVAGRVDVWDLLAREIVAVKVGVVRQHALAGALRGPHGGHVTLDGCPKRAVERNTKIHVPSAHARALCMQDQNEMTHINLERRNIPLPAGTLPIHSLPQLELISGQLPRSHGVWVSVNAVPPAWGKGEERGGPANRNKKQKKKNNIT